MAFAKGNDNKDAVVGFSNKKYWGMGTFNIVAVNPNKAQLEDMGFYPEEEPIYIKKNDEGKKQAVIELFFKPTEEYNIDYIFRSKITITEHYVQGKESGKYEIIDQFGRTAWATREDIENKRIPMYSNGPANITSDYRVTFQGERVLTDVLKAFLDIKNPAEYKNNTWILKDDTSNCEARLDTIPKFFNGDFSEITSVLKNRPNNKIRLMVGISKKDDKEYMNVYLNKVAYVSSNGKDILNDIKESKQRGGLTNIEFIEDVLQEYVVETSKPSTPSSSPSPFDNEEKPFAPF